MIKKPLIAAYALIGAFLLFSILRSNYEFFVYAAILIVLIILLDKTDSIFHYEEFALWGFVAWIASHLAGGFLIVNGSALYAYVLIPIVGEPYSLLKYDQVMHVFCYLVFSMLVYSVVKKQISSNASKIAFATIVILASIGVGSLNEILEFGTTIFWDTGVGGYENNSIDLVANLLGAIIGTTLMLKLSPLGNEAPKQVYSKSK